MKRLLPLIALLIALAPATAQADLTAPETLLLDTYSGASTGFAGPVTSSDALTSGRYYVAAVDGTFSAYLPRLYEGHGWIVCGRSEAAPTLPSPGRPDSRVNQDAAFLFGFPQQEERCSRPMPFAYAGFQTNLGSGFTHVTPAGAPTATSTDHAYSYLLRGQGSSAQFRMTDTNTTDNNGILRVVLRPATAQDCGDNADCLNGIPAASQGVAAAAPSTTTIPLPKKSCVSRRAFRIRVVSRKSDPVTAATIRLSSTNKRFKTRTRRLNGRKRVTAGINLRGLPAGTYRVLITAKTKKGRVLVGRRTYRTCTVKKQSKRPPL